MVSSVEETKERGECSRKNGFRYGQHFTFCHEYFKFLMQTLFHFIYLFENGKSLIVSIETSPNEPEILLL